MASAMLGCIAISQVVLALNVSCTIFVNTEEVCQLARPLFSHGDLWRRYFPEAIPTSWRDVLTHWSNTCP